MNLTEARKRIIASIDVATPEEAGATIVRLHSYVAYIKFGLSLIVPFGLDHVCTMALNHGCTRDQIFTDVKLSDDPDMVAATARQLARHGVGMFNVHATAGSVALTAAATNRGKALVLAETVPTAIGAGECRLIFGHEPIVQVVTLACRAEEAGVQGIICGAKDLALQHEYSKLNRLIKMTPVQPSWIESNKHDRLTTPGEAIKAGATHVIIDSSFFRGPSNNGDYEAAAHLVAEEIAGALEEVAV